MHADSQGKRKAKVTEPDDKVKHFTGSNIHSTTNNHLRRRQLISTRWESYRCGDLAHQFALQVEHEKSGKPSSRRPRGSKLGKISLASFESPEVRRLAKVGHRRLRQHVATVEAFPFPNEKDELCWRLVQETAVKESGLEHVLAEVEKEHDAKERLLDYVRLLFNTNQ